jgi:hypothetical protein
MIACVYVESVIECPFTGKDSVMKKYFVLGFLLCLCGTAAAGIYKWTDEEGKVHYGDKNDNPKNGTQLKFKAPETPAQKEGTTGSAASEMIPENSPATKQTANLQQCLQMARTRADKKSRDPSEIRADSKKLLDLCPDTSYSCVTYIERPEANNCTAEPMQPGGSIIRNNTYRR